MRSIMKSFSGVLALILLFVGSWPAQTLAQQTGAKSQGTPGKPTPDPDSEWYDRVQEMILQEYTDNSPVDPDTEDRDTKSRRIIGRAFFSVGVLGALLGVLLDPPRACRSKITAQCNVQSPSQ